MHADGHRDAVDLGLARDVEDAAQIWRARIGKPLAGGGAAPTAERGLPAPTAESGLTAPTAEDAQQAALELRALLLDPLWSKAPDARRWIVYLDDVLLLVPLDSLPLDGAIVGDRIEWCILNSFADLVAPRQPPSDAPRLVAPGGADFDAASSGAEPDATTGAQAATPSDRGLIRSKWGPLVETRAETSNLGALFRQTFEAEPTVLQGKVATNTALSGTMPGARWIHVATHGYFAPESVAGIADPAPEGRAWSALTLSQSVDGLAPMELCGLALAGANRGADELGRVAGFLTAEELAGLEFSTCELAVLSACETKVGLRRAGLGIQSLQAALHAAVARYAITSLWRVEDEGTRALFEDFYRRVWLEKQPKGKALWAARMALRAAGRPARDWAGWALRRRELSVRSGHIGS